MKTWVSKLFVIHSLVSTKMGSYIQSTNMLAVPKTKYECLILTTFKLLLIRVNKFTLNQSTYSLHVSSLLIMRLFIYEFQNLILFKSLLFNKLYLFPDFIDFFNNFHFLLLFFILGTTETMTGRTSVTLCLILPYRIFSNLRIILYRF